MMEQRVRLFAISAAVSSVLLVLAILSRNAGILGNAAIISTFVMSAPQLVLSYQKFRSFKEMEEVFPNFLRDVAESVRSGVPLYKAIQNTGKSEYGRLSAEIKKMSHQISWGMNVEKVLDQFAERVRTSKRLYSAVKIIRESYLLGGNLADTIESVANNSGMLEEAQREKRSILSQYVMLMYAISIIFIIIVVAINRLLVPIFESTSQVVGQQLGLVNPCGSVSGAEVYLCAFLGGTSSMVFGIQENTIGSYYIALFFYMAMIQAIFSGLVAGQISDNSLVAGIKHSLILGGIVFGSFSIIVWTKLLGV
jgi:archaeal flagellar protein FlaJ